MESVSVRMRNFRRKPQKKTAEIVSAACACQKLFFELE
jgi:hypothetical protein